MSALSPILRDAEGGILHFWCPGCDGVHGIKISKDGKDGWTWNGDPNKPTFRPSVLVRRGHFSERWKKGDPCSCTYNKEHPEAPTRFGCMRCHSFVTDGRIQFLADCSHTLAGKTVDLPAWTEVGT